MPMKYHKEWKIIHSSNPGGMYDDVGGRMKQKTKDKRIKQGPGKGAQVKKGIYDDVGVYGRDKRIKQETNVITPKGKHRQRLQKKYDPKGHSRVYAFKHGGLVRHNPLMKGKK